MTLLEVERPRQALRRPAGRGRARPARRGGRDRRPHRPERRGQDHGLPPHRGLSRAHVGRHPVQGRVHRRAQAARDLPARAGADLPDRAALRRAQHARQRDGRRVQPGRRRGGGARARARDHRASSGSGRKRDVPARTLTLADRKRLEMARGLATRPELLLLDEVMSGLNPTEIDEIIALIRRVHATRREPAHHRARDAGHHGALAPARRPAPRREARGGAARRGRPGPARHRGLSRRGGAAHEPPRAAGRGGGLRRPARAPRRLPRGRGGRDALRGRRQRRRQDHHAARHLGAPAPARRPHPVRRRAPRPDAEPRDRRARRGAGAGRPQDLPGPHREGEPRARLLRRPPRARIAARASSACSALFPRLAERQRQAAGTMSGGEQQMLAIGRALMARPRILMLDEPSLGLAPIIVQEIFRIIAEINRARHHGAPRGAEHAPGAQPVPPRLRARERAHRARGHRRELLGNEHVRRAYLGM